MPKRSSVDKIDYYKNKIKKIEEKINKKRHYKRVVYSDEASENEENENDPISSVITIPPPNNDSESLIPNDTTPVLLEIESAATQSVTPVDEHTTEVQDLDPNILVALGAQIQEDPEYGENIHDKLAQMWLPLLKKGMVKEERDKIIKEYSIPGNCTLLQAPKLNPEIFAAITESARARDKKIQQDQQQLGVGITSINRAMNALMSEDDNAKLSAIKHLSNACRILGDLHYSKTQTRIKIVTSGLDKTFLTMIQDSIRDETLFGTNLSEKIKASKAIEKQVLQIKKPAVAVSSVSTPSASSSRQNPVRGNWMGPPRYVTNRSGRGGAKKAPAPRKPYVPTQPTSKLAGRHTTRVRRQH